MVLPCCMMCLPPRPATVRGGTQHRRMSLLMSAHQKYGILTTERAFSSTVNFLGGIPRKEL